MNILKISRNGILLISIRVSFSLLYFVGVVVVVVVVFFSCFVAYLYVNAAKATADNFFEYTIGIWPIAKGEAMAFRIVSTLFFL